MSSFKEKPKLWLHFRLGSGPTCQAGQKKLIGALSRHFVNVGNDGEGVLPVVERMATDDAQVLQGNSGRRVECDEDIAAHLFDRLWKEIRARAKKKRVIAI